MRALLLALCALLASCGSGGIRRTIVVEDPILSGYEAQGTWDLRFGEATMVVDLFGGYAEVSIDVAGPAAYVGTWDGTLLSFGGYVLYYDRPTDTMVGDGFTFDRR